MSQPVQSGTDEFGHPTEALRRMWEDYIHVREQAAERATWAALAALHGVPSFNWWETFKRVLAEHGHEVIPNGK